MMRIRRQDHPRGGRRLVTEMIADSGSGGSGPSAQAQSVAGHRNTTRYKRAGENKEKKKKEKERKRQPQKKLCVPFKFNSEFRRARGFESSIPARSLLLLSASRMLLHINDSKRRERGVGLRDGVAVDELTFLSVR